MTNKKPKQEESIERRNKAMISQLERQLIKNKNMNKGFTLIEVAIVLSAITILSAVFHHCGPLGC